MLGDDPLIVYRLTRSTDRYLSPRVKLAGKHCTAPIFERREGAINARKPSPIDSNKLFKL